MGLANTIRIIRLFTPFGFFWENLLFFTNIFWGSCKLSHHPIFHPRFWSPTRSSNAASMLSDAYRCCWHHLF